MFISIHVDYEYDWTRGRTASEVLTRLLGVETRFVTNRGAGEYPDIFLIDAENEEDIVFLMLKSCIPFKITAV